MNAHAIAILSFNHPDLTEKCIKSVLALNYSGEIYLIHNGSHEKNVLNLKNLFPDITHLVIEKNKGYTGGANFTLSEVFKKYQTCLFLTNDTELQQLPKSIPTDFSSVHSLKRKTEFIDSLGGLIDIKNGKLLHRKNMSDVYNTKQFIPYIPGTAFWITKSIFESLKGFDETFHTYWEDVDFSYRAHLSDISVNHSFDTIIRHKIGKTCHKDDFYTYYLYQRNRKKFMQKHGLTSLRFWFLFYKDLLRMNKNRFKTTWKIIND
jgi:GT2 family glycosyltransferase